MLSNDDIFHNAMSKHCGTNFDFCLIDFSLVHPNVPLTIKLKSRKFRDELIRTFANSEQRCERGRYRYCKWTIEFIWSTIIDDVIALNENLKSAPEKHTLIFVCFDNGILPTQQALLKRSYMHSIFFQLDNTDTNSNYEAIFNYLRNDGDSQHVPKATDYFYPLCLHANSISSGLFFNYYYSYLNRQVGSTNNIFLTFTFNRDIVRETLPSKICVVMNTLIEKIYLEKYSSRTPSDILVPWQSNPLMFELEPIKNHNANDKERVATYYVAGVGDFGVSVEKICIWQEKLDHQALVSIQLQDDVRQWNQTYWPCPFMDSINEQQLAIFKEENNSPRQCQLFAIVNKPDIVAGHGGISTMKKTTKDCYDVYISDLRNLSNEQGQRIAHIRVVPTYYILALSSCNFGPPDTNKTSQCEVTTLRGTITDPDEPNRIHLAYAYGEVLRSRPMMQYNRYLRRTFYYIDVIDENNEIVRYLFCGEYPYILSTLNRMEQIGLISKAQKRDGYLRFCNMINRILILDNLSESIKLIQFDDEDRHRMIQFDDDTSAQVSFADFKLLWMLITEDIQQWYERPDEDTSLIDIIPRILQSEANRHVMIFSSDEIGENQLIMLFIKNLKEQLKNDGYLVDDIHGDLNAIEGTEQMIFICTDRQNDYANHRIIQAVQRKINRRGVLRDVFVLINEAICHFPCHIIRSIPYITFNLDECTPKLINDKIQEVIYYLTNMNILSESYPDLFENTSYLAQETPLQCTSVGEGCAAAFYFNYAELLTPLTDHRRRMDIIYQQLGKEKCLDSLENKSIFICKWVFILPWIIENSSQLLSYGLSLNEDEQKTIGLKLTVWKPADKNFINPNLSITVGGIFQRSYSPLTVYKLTNLIDGKTFYFPMEIPAALHGLQNQYQNIFSRFNFGTFNSTEQAITFREKVEEYKSRDQNAKWHKWIMFVPLNRPSTNLEKNCYTHYEQAEVLLKSLWQRLSLYVQSTTQSTAATTNSSVFSIDDSGKLHPH